MKKQQASNLYRIPDKDVLFQLSYASSLAKIVIITYYESH